MKKAVDPITEMKRELAALTKKVATLEKQLAKAAICGDITCTSLTVVDRQGKTVASIDGKGLVECRGATVTSSGTRDRVVLDGDHGRVQCTRFDLVNGTDGNEAMLIQMDSTKGAPYIELCSQGEPTSIRINSVRRQGGVINVNDRKGFPGVNITVSEQTSSVLVANSKLGEGNVGIYASYVNNGDGTIATFDNKGTVTAVMPPDHEAVKAKTPTQKEVLNSSSRKPAK